MRAYATLVLGAFIGQTLTPEVARAMLAQFPAEKPPVDVTALPTMDCGSIRFAAERMHDILPGLDVLHHAQWKETEGYQDGTAMNPATEEWLIDDMTGGLVQFTARDRVSGDLVGQCRMYLTRSRHTRRPIAIEDTLFLLPEYRRGRAAWRMGEYVEACLRILRVKDAYLDDKVGNPAAGRLLDAQGYKIIATRRFKKLED